MPTRVQVVMFDLDGTLIDTMNGFADVAAAVMEEHHQHPASIGRGQYLQTSGIPFRQQLELIHPAHPANDAASDVFEARKRQHADSANLDDDTVAALARLRALGLKLVVSSNSAQHFVDEFAERQAFKFDLVLGFEEGFAKGRPHVARTRRELGADIVVLFCGDSLKDGDLALESEVDFVGRLGTFTREDFHRWNPQAPVVASIAELADYLEERTTV